MTTGMPTLAPLLLTLHLAVPSGPAAPGPGGPGHGALTGRIVDDSGAPVPRALVTARTGAGVAVTVYTDDEGRYTLPDLPWPLEAVEARSHELGVVRRSTAGGGAGGTLDLRLGADAETLPPTGADWLSRLPDGETKRRFVLDCSGCHVWNESWVRVDGARREPAAWADAIARMKETFGPGSAFPVVSAWPDPAELGTWLDEGFGPGTPAPGAPPATAVAEAVGAELTEFDLPEPGDLPHDLAVDADGRVLITGMFTHRMYDLDPATGVFTTRPVPVEAANPRAVDLDARGRWWVLLGAPQRLARFDPVQERWDSWDIGMYPHSIVLDDGGRVWFNGHFTADPELLGSLDPATGVVTRYEVQPRGAGSEGSTMPYGLRIDAAGRLWGTQLHGNGLVRLDPADGDVDQWEMPRPHSGPRRLDVGPDGTVWIPEYAAGRLARFDPATETFTEYELPLRDALPYVVRVDARRGWVWVGTGHGDAVLRFDPATEAFTVYPLPTRGALIRHLDVDEARGEVWAAYGASPGIPAKILRIRP